MNRFFRAIAVVLSFSLLPFNSRPLLAQDTQWQENIPEALEAWIPWATRSVDERKKDCFVKSPGGGIICSWLPRVQLSLDERGAEAEIEVVLDSEKAFVLLPSSASIWPEKVLIGGIEQVVLKRNRQAVVELKKGSYRINASYRWEQIPASFPLPNRLALLDMQVNGKKIAFPRREANGDVWTQRVEEPKDTKKQNDRLELEVFRKLRDGIPQTIESILSLRVSGKNRELRLPRSHFFGRAYKVESALPVQIDGRSISLQLRAGNYRLSVHSWLDEPQTSFQLPEADYWPQEEIWATESVTELRTVEFLGGQAISIEQTNAPREWSSLPLLRLDSAAQLEVKELRRGGTRAARDTLQLKKQLWLAFDGEEFTVKDAISGTIADAGRLAFVGQGSLGRVTINGVDQYITKVEGEPGVGVEVREGTIEMSAESKLAVDAPLLSAWNRDFDGVSGVLKLPPGWKLLFARGVDWVSSSWVKTWSLLDVFLVLLATIACYRMFSPLAGGIAAVALILVEPEQSFAISLLSFLAFSSLASVLPKGGLRKASTYLACLLLFGVAIQALFFSAGHLRDAFYPQLRGFSMGVHSYPTTEAMYDAVGRGMEMEEAGVAAVKPSQSLNAAVGSVSGAFHDYAVAPKAQAFKARRKTAQSQYVLDSNRTTQTGYGVATWSGRTVSFGWTGPMQKDQSFQFSLLSPWMNTILACVRVLLLVGVLALVGRSFVRVVIRPERTEALLGVGLLLCFALLSSGPRAAYADDSIPSQKMLNDLRDYVIAERDKAPECRPNCVNLSQLVVSDSDAGIQLEFVLHSLDTAATPLFARSDLYSVRFVGREERPQYRLSAASSMIWTGLTEGVHRLRVLLTPGASQELQVQLGLEPAQVLLQSAVWKSDTLRDGRIPGKTLSLRRKQVATSAKASTQASTASRIDTSTSLSRLDALYTVKRTLTLGVNWTVQTEVLRVSPASSSAQLQVPLLAGESVTSGSIEVVDGNAQVVLPAGLHRLAWSSSLNQNSELTLTAPQNVPWREVWAVNATNLWNVSFAGTPRIYSAESASSAIPQWAPRAGESLTIRSTQPEGIQGPTTTIDSVEQSYAVGTRLQEVTLEYSVRTSKGELQEVKIPQDAELTALEVNGKARPLRTKDGVVKIDLAPGAQKVKLLWREARELGFRFSNSEVSLGARAVNVKTRVRFPNDRWLLYLQGPLVGPAVLFWAAFPICLGVAFLLSRWTLSPLSFWQWTVLFIGLSQVSLFTNGIIVAWFVLFALRNSKEPNAEKPTRFRLQQLLLGILTILAVGALFQAIEQGLLASPRMHVQGVNSGAYYYFWFQDAIEDLLPVVSVYSLPMLWYRGFMLVWALWLSFSAIAWLKWAWAAYSKGGYWIPTGIRWRREKKAKQREENSES